MTRKKRRRRARRGPDRARHGGKNFGEFTLSVVVYDEDRVKVEHTVAEFQKLFTQHDGLLYEERYKPAQCVLCDDPRQSAVQPAQAVGAELELCRPVISVQHRCRLQMESATG